MSPTSLEKFIAEIRKAWGPLSSKSVENSQKAFADLAKAEDLKNWLANAFRDSADDKELYRDPEHGYVLSAYTEKEGRYRIPHDHGSGWVFYAVVSGEMEMSTYRRAITQSGKLQLVRRESYRMQPGDSKVFLPQDIHDTRCVSDSVIVLRLTSTDLKKEDREGRMIRYPEQTGR